MNPLDLSAFTDMVARAIPVVLALGGLGLGAWLLVFRAR